VKISAIGCANRADNIGAASIVFLAIYVKNRAKAKKKSGAKRKPNPYPGKPRGMPIWAWVEYQDSLDRYITRWAAGLIRTEVDEHGRVTTRRMNSKEVEELSRRQHSKHSKLLQKRIEQLRARKAAEQILRAKHAAMCRWRPG